MPRKSPSLDDYMRRGRRIQSLGADGAAAFEAARLLADEIGSLFGPLAVCDIFENIVHLWKQRLPEQSGKQGAHDSSRDGWLLWMFNEDDPVSPISRARRGDLPKGNNQFYKPMNKTELAAIMVDTPEKRELWGAQSSTQLLRRLKYLRAQQRTK